MCNQNIWTFSFPESSHSTSPVKKEVKPRECKHEKPEVRQTMSTKEKLILLIHFGKDQEPDSSSYRFHFPSMDFATGHQLISPFLISQNTNLFQNYQKLTCL